MIFFFVKVATTMTSQNLQLKGPILVIYLLVLLAGPRGVQGLVFGPPLSADRIQFFGASHLRHKCSSHVPSSSRRFAISNSNNKHEYNRLTETDHHVQVANTILKHSRLSFRNVEGLTDDLLSNHPILAVGVFLGFVLLIAYMSGFVILDGYISSVNPLENGAVPYWDEDVANELTSLPQQL
jgi:hypothetical protein